MSSNTSLHAAYISRARPQQVSSEFTDGVVTERQPKAHQELLQLLGQGRGSLDGADGFTRLPKRSSDASQPAPTYGPERLSNASGFVGRLAERCIANFSRLESPSFKPRLTKPLLLPWCYVGRATLACGVAFACGVGYSVANAWMLPAGILLAMHHGAADLQKVFSDAWILSCWTGCDDALAADLAGAARLAENDKASKVYQAMQSTLRAQYRITVENLTNIASAAGSFVGTLAMSALLTGALMPAMPAISTIGLSVGIYATATALRIYLMPRIEQWRQRKENECSNQGSEAMPVLSGGLPGDYTALRARHDEQLFELSFRNTCAKLLRNGFSAVEAGLFIGLFGLRNNNMSMLGSSLMRAFTSGRNINVCMARATGVRDEYLERFIAPPLLEHIQVDKLQVSREVGEPSTKLSDMMDDLEHNRPSLWTLRGTNGAGKSTFMRLAKEAYGMGAVCESAKTTFGKDGEPLTTQSTGQAKLERLQHTFEYAEQHNTRLLLDEPSGPLHPDAARKNDARLQKFADSRCVIVITHLPAQSGGAQPAASQASAAGPLTTDPAGSTGNSHSGRDVGSHRLRRRPSQGRAA